MSAPRVSVVVPVYNGRATLDRCLQAILASGWDDREVIVVDDASTDGSAEVALRHPVCLLRLDQNRGAAVARNEGGRLARGEILFFLDADVIVETDTLGRIVASLDGAPGTSALFCSFQPHTPPTNFVSAYKNLRHHYTHQTSARDAATFCGGFGAIRREAFLEAGGFDAELRYLEDVDLGYRLHCAGHRILLEPSIQVTHEKHYSLWRLVRSDVVGRAIPWTRLMLRHRIFRSDLNTRPGNVASVGATWLFVAALAAGLFVPALLLAAPALAVGLIALNCSFLGFLRQEMGLTFAVRSVPLLVLGYLYSGAGAVAGVAAYVRRR